MKNFAASAGGLRPKDTRGNFSLPKEGGFGAFSVSWARGFLSGRLTERSPFKKLARTQFLSTTSNHEKLAHTHYAGRGVIWRLLNPGFSIATSNMGPKTNSARFFLRGMVILLSYWERLYVPKDRNSWMSANNPLDFIESEVTFNRCGCGLWGSDVKPYSQEILGTSYSTVVAVEGMLRLQTHNFLEMAQFQLRKWKSPLFVIRP